MFSEEIVDLVRRSHALLRADGATVAVAESLTGGLLTAALTHLAGASDVVRGGLVVYVTELKTQLAGVDESLLADGGAVQSSVADQLARGAAERLGATYGVGVTGVAGPAPQDGRAVGTVFVAVSGPSGVVVQELALAGDRVQIRLASVLGALTLLCRECASGAGGLHSS